MTILSENEISDRRKLGGKYFVPGRLYKVEEEYRAWIPSGDSKPAKKIFLEKDSIILCTKSGIEPPGGPEVFQFIYKDKVIHYVSGAWSLCVVFKILESTINE